MFFRELFWRYRALIQPNEVQFTYQSRIALLILRRAGDEVSPEQKKWIFLNRDWKVGCVGVKNCGIPMPEWKDFGVVFYGDDLSSGIFRCTGPMRLLSDLLEENG